MNLRNVLRAYSLLRQLSDDETALLNILRALNDNDREQLVASMSDKPQKKAGKKSAATTREYDHCLRCGTTKRDSSHKNQSSPDYHEFQSSKDIDFCARCKGATEAHPVHHEKQFGGYHPFESSKKTAGGGGKSRAVEFCGKCGTPKDRPAHNDRATSDYHPFEPSKSKHASSLQQQIGNRAQSPIQPPATATTIDDDGSGRCQAKRSDDRICMLLPDHNIHHLPTVMDYHEFVAPPASSAAGAGD